MFSSSDRLDGQIVQIPLGERWQIFHRLQDLMVPCWCPDDGSLRVEVNSCRDAILVRTIVQQFMASRPELIDWLERCWNI